MRADEPDELPDHRWLWLDLRLWPVAATVWALGLTAPYLDARTLWALAGCAGASALAVPVTGTDALLRAT